MLARDGSGQRDLGLMVVLRGELEAVELQRLGDEAGQIDRLALRIGLEAYDLPFAVGITVLLLACIIWILSRPRVKSFFREN